MQKTVHGVPLAQDISTNIARQPFQTRSERRPQGTPTHLGTCEDARAGIKPNKTHSWQHMDFGKLKIDVTANNERIAVLVEEVKQFLLFNLLRRVIKQKGDFQASHTST